MFSFSSHDVLAIAVVASFASGLNVYATVATLGLLSHFHAFELPPALDLLNSWPVIVAAAVLFGLEFFADKIPVFDLLWNALHTLCACLWRHCFLLARLRIFLPKLRLRPAPWAD